MNGQHALLADSVVSATALAGVLAAIAVIRARSTPDGLRTRFIWALGLVAVILALRLLYWNLGVGLFEMLTRLAAAWVPLASLTVLEGLQRRHAPKPLKYAVLIGGGVFSLLAFVGFGWSFPLYGLLAFQLLGLIAIYVLAVSSVPGLTAQEQRVIAGVRFALPVLVVFLLSDYGVFEQFVPVRASGIAILFFCWMAIGPASVSSSRREAGTAFVVTALLAILIGTAATAMAARNWDYFIQISAMVLCTGILTLLLYEAMRAFAESRRDDVLKALVHADTSTVHNFIASVAAHSPLRGATIIEGAQLADFDSAELRASFVVKPVLSRSDLTAMPENTRQQFDSLFMTYDATNLILLSADPLIIAAAALPALGNRAAVETELGLLQRMAALIATKQERPDGAA